MEIEVPGLDFGLLEGEQGRMNTRIQTIVQNIATKLNPFVEKIKPEKIFFLYDHLYEDVQNSDGLNLDGLDLDSDFSVSCLYLHGRQDGLIGMGIIGAPSILGGYYPSELQVLFKRSPSGLKFHKVGWCDAPRLGNLHGDDALKVVVFVNRLMSKDMFLNFEFL